MKYSKITGTGSYLPERIMTNADIEKFVDTLFENSYCTYKSLASAGLWCVIHDCSVESGAIFYPIHDVF